MSRILNFQKMLLKSLRILHTKKVYIQIDNELMCIFNLNSFFLLKIDMFLKDVKMLTNFDVTSMS